MTETASLAAALAKFQAEMPLVGKDRTAKVGAYSYTYAGLADVTAAAMPILTKHGLSFSCCPRRSAEGDYDLYGVLLHTSGQSLEGCLPIQGTKAQEIGSAITYGRRYLLGAMTGLVTDDDDDGALAHKAEKRATRAKAPVEDQWTDAKGKLPMAEKTRKRMFALFGDHKITDEELQRAGMSTILGREVASRGELTEGEAQLVIAALRARPKPEVTP